MPPKGSSNKRAKEVRLQICNFNVIPRLRKADATVNNNAPIILHGKENVNISSDDRDLAVVILSTALTMAAGRRLLEMAVVNGSRFNDEVAERLWNSPQKPHAELEINFAKLVKNPTFQRLGPLLLRGLLVESAWTPGTTAEDHLKLIADAV